MGAVASCTGRNVKVHTQDNPKSPGSIVNSQNQVSQPQDDTVVLNSNTAVPDSSSGPGSLRSGHSPRRSTDPSPGGHHNFSPRSHSHSPVSPIFYRSSPSSGSEPSPMQYFGRATLDGASPNRARASQRDSQQEEEEDESPSARAAAELFAHTAMSLGMDNEDLLLNLMYFDEGFGGGNATFGTLMNTLQQETLALHSANNTPYKLNPANDTAIAGLIEETYIEEVTGTETECLVCRDDLESGCCLSRIPTCKHYFHKECLERWIQLQAWCPICRSSLENVTKGASSVMKPSMETVHEIYHTHSNSEYDRMEEGECCDENQEQVDTGVGEEEEISARMLARKLVFTDDATAEESSVQSKRMMESPSSEAKESARYDHEDEKRDYGSKSMYEEEAKESPTQTPRSVEQSVAMDSAEKIIHRAMSIAMKEIEAK